MSQSGASREDDDCRDSDRQGGTELPSGCRGLAWLRLRVDGLVQVLVTERHPDGEQDDRDEGKEQPAVDDVIDPDGQLVVGEMGDEHDTECAEPIGNDRNQDREPNEHDSTPP